MKHLLFAVCLLLSAFSFTSCNKNDDDTDAIIGVWSGGAQFEGPPRSGAVTFTINNRAYVGLGWNGTDKFKDFWVYNPDNRSWRQIAPFPGVARYNAVAFAVGNKGYVGTGYDGANRLSDFYEYDPNANTWTKKKDFAGGARYSAVGLSIGDKGYVGTGYGTISGTVVGAANLKDFWEYNPSTDAWTQKASLFGNKRIGATAFTIGSYGYVLSGTDNGATLTDNEAYDPSTDTWTSMRSLTNNSTDGYDYSAVARNYGASFVVNGKGYVTAGEGSKVDCWEFNPEADTWTQKTNFPGAARTYAVGFGLGSTGYVATGSNGSTRLDDVWELAPDATE
jgi:N-acetylneuraminic acid mutarotase